MSNLRRTPATTLARSGAPQRICSALRRQRLLQLLIVALVPVANAAAVRAAPNIVFILTDD